MELDDSKIMTQSNYMKLLIYQTSILLKVTCLEFQAEHVDDMLEKSTGKTFDAAGMDPSHLAAEVGLRNHQFSPKFLQGGPQRSVINGVKYHSHTLP